MSFQRMALIFLLFCSAYAHESHLRGTVGQIWNGLYNAGFVDATLHVTESSITPETFSSAFRLETPKPHNLSQRHLRGELHYNGKAEYSRKSRRPMSNMGVNSPSMHSLQGQALGPTDLPVTLPFASPSVTTP